MALDDSSLRTPRLAPSLAIAFLLLLGCDNGEVESRGEPATAERATEVPENETPSSTLFPLRDGERHTGGPTRDAACDYLTAARAAALLEVPEDELVARGSCAYRWQNETDVAYASVDRVYVYDDLEGSRESFRTATADRASEGTQREAAKVFETAADRLGEDGRAAGDATRDVVVGAADFAQRYEPLEGIGDEAAFARHDGQVIVRLANMRFAVTAYRCPREPDAPAPTREQLRNLGELSRQARARTQAWIADTIRVRRRMAVELARQVVDALEDYRASL